MDVKLLTLKEASVATGRSYQVLWTLCNAGKIRYHRKGINCKGAYLVKLEWINEYIESTTVEPNIAKPRVSRSPIKNVVRSTTKKPAGKFVGFAHLVGKTKVKD